jgi:hypothetical protein
MGFCVSVLNGQHVVILMREMGGRDEFFEKS